jgi:hypothetical protein
MHQSAAHHHKSTHMLQLCTARSACTPSRPLPPCPEIGTSPPAASTCHARFSALTPCTSQNISSRETVRQQPAAAAAENHTSTAREQMLAVFLPAGPVSAGSGFTAVLWPAPRVRLHGARPAASAHRVCSFPRGKSATTRPKLLHGAPANASAAPTGLYSPLTDPSAGIMSFVTHRRANILVSAVSKIDWMS